MMKVCAGNENAVVGSLRHYLHLKEQPITKNKGKVSNKKTTTKQFVRYDMHKELKLCMHKKQFCAKRVLFLLNIQYNKCKLFVILLELLCSCYIL